MSLDKDGNLEKQDIESYEHETSRNPDNRVDDFHTLGRKELGLTEEEPKPIVDFVHNLGLTDKITALDVRRVLDGVFFAVGTRKINNTWKEHAAIVREFCENWNDENTILDRVKKMFNLKRGDRYEDVVSSQDNERIKTLCKNITNYYSFFCGYSHHRYNQIVNSWRRIQNDFECSNDEALKEKYFIIFLSQFLKEIIELKSLVEEYESS